MRIVFWLAALGCAAAHAGHAQHVIVIGVDGLGAAGLRDAMTPRLTQMRQAGAWTLHARGVMPTVSSPNWASMIMGAGPEQHGITSNEWRPDRFEIAPVCKGSDDFFPTMFGLLRQQRPQSRIGVFHHWADFARLVERKAPDIIQHFKTAEETMGAARTYWAKVKPDLLFIHLDHVDHAGHDHGWKSEEYREAVKKADELIGQMLDAVRESGQAESTVVLVTGDHGGSGTKHGGLTMAELEIPWLLTGPGVKRGHEVTGPVNTYDTAATVASVLGLTPPACWVGKRVSEAFGEQRR